MTENTENSSLKNDDTVSWQETIPPKIRRKRAAIRLVVAIAIAAFFLYMGFSNGEFDNKSLSWAAIIFCIGVILFWSNLNKTSIQRFAVERVRLSRGQRAKKAFPFWLLGYGGALSTWAMQYRFDDLKENWHIGFGFFVIGVVGNFIFSNLEYESKLTSEAAELQAIQAAIVTNEPKTPSELDILLEKIWERKLVRFPVAIGLYWGAFELSQSDYPKKWIFTALIALMGIGAAPELILFVIGASLLIGLLVFGFNVVASLPISIAVIVGALIIASAVKK